MRGLLISVVMSVLGALAWWAVEPLGMAAAFVASMIASGVGLYYGRKLVDHLLP